MKTHILKVSTLIVILLITSLNGCKKADEANPAASCKLTRQLYSSTTSLGTYLYDVQYSFDASGRFTGQSSQTVNTPKTGAKTTSSSKQTLVYDADGFLTSQNTTYESTESGKTTVQSNSKTYEYADGRLVKDVGRDIATTGDVGNSSTKYEYESNGKIAKITLDSRGTLYIQTFTNGLLTKYLVRATNGTETQPATINSQGLITKNVRGSTSYDTYEYDTQQRVVREENWFNNKLNSYRLNEYDDKKAAFGSTNPVFKGHPVVVTNGKYVNNATRYTTYGLDGVTGLMKKQYDYVYTFAYNAKGYPTEYTMTDAVSGQTAKTVFTLVDCD
jgi:YD repeat-containing protein